ncbi:restriction endonuclease subunit S [Cutibacterium sp.]|uniref:restriction endonuclease subunit S n=1 Tax=Cutibacterium sp. TaxID=1912221 RepID=UPI0026DB14FA|nr:restriction endonuclease subunit S [Cutibacterium sp.]MDO4411848.1 restriction endonuclease subunit S [Cutibacterium sp.]
MTIDSVLLSEVADIQTGPFGSQLHNKDYVKEGTPIVTVEHLGSRRFTSQNLPFVSEKDKKRLSKYAMLEGDIIFSRVGSVDRCSYVSSKENGWLFSGRCLRVRPTSKINGLYLYYYLSSKPVGRYIRNVAVGATMPSINTSLLGEVPVSLPSFEEQSCIASVLSSIDDKIEFNERTNDYLANILDVLFNEIIAGRPHDWTAMSLLDIANYKNGLAMQRFRPVGGDKGLPVIKIRELRQGYCGADAERCRSDIDESVTIHDGDLIFSWSGTLLLDFWTGGDSGLNQHLFKVTSDTYPSWFYYMWTKQHMRRFISLAKNRATTMGHIKRNELRESKVLIPPPSRMEDLTAHIQPIVDEMIGLKVQSRKLGELRDSLLPKLMSGEIDVSQIELPMQLNNHLYG